jgi:DNA polymerase-4/DNA polymerase V
MSDPLFCLHSWPRSILHNDADAFFASCEEAIHPELRGLPIVTGAERGIIACASYAAKAMGIKRGVSIHDARRLCPNLIILPSDYETYSLFSKRMFDIMRQFSPQVEEYSIDEAFVDISGLRRVHHGSYESIAGKIKREIESDLGITVSIGLSLTKVLAKIGSQHRKPGGMTPIPGGEIARYLRSLPIEKVWGIGPATTSYLNKMGVTTALDFATLPEITVRKGLTKPGIEIWQELRGESVYPVSAEEKNTYASISKMKTFTPPTGHRAYLYAQLVRNLESACIKARRYHLAALRIVAILRKQNFQDRGCEMRLNRPSSYPVELAVVLKGMFDELFQEKEVYRATAVILLDLKPDMPMQLSLFDDPQHVDRACKTYLAVDLLNQKYGKHAVHLGASHAIEVMGKGRRGETTIREQTRLFGETKRKHLGLPIIHTKGV